MHIPDGLLSLELSALFWVLWAAFLAFALRRAEASLERRALPLLGVLSAGLFAAQMLNFPIPGGTSGHLVGGFLVALLFGPYASVIVISAVLVLQAVLLGDGGITALGANALNMGVLGGFLAYYIYIALSRISNARVWSSASIFFAGWLSTVLAALLAALELGASGTIPFQIAIPAMVFWHALIGIGEGALTLLVISYLASINSEMLRFEKLKPKISLSLGGALLSATTILALLYLLLPLSSARPDGLERTLADSGVKTDRQQFITPILEGKDFISALLATSLFALSSYVLITGKKG